MAGLRCAPKSRPPRRPQIAALLSVVFALGCFAGCASGVRTAFTLSVRGLRADDHLAAALDGSVLAPTRASAAVRIVQVPFDGGSCEVQWQFGGPGDVGATLKVEGACASKQSGILVAFKLSRQGAVLMSGAPNDDVARKAGMRTLANLKLYEFTQGDKNKRFVFQMTDYGAPSPKAVVTYVYVPTGPVCETSLYSKSALTCTQLKDNQLDPKGRELARSIHIASERAYAVEFEGVLRRPLRNQLPRSPSGEHVNMSASDSKKMMAAFDESFQDSKNWHVATAELRSKGLKAKWYRKIIEALYFPMLQKCMEEDVGQAAEGKACIGADECGLHSFCAAPDGTPLSSVATLDPQAKTERQVAAARPPTPRPSSRPSERHTARPTARSTAKPTAKPTARPTARPTPKPWKPRAETSPPAVGRKQTEGQQELVHRPVKRREEEEPNKDFVSKAKETFTNWWQQATESGGKRWDAARGLWLRVADPAVDKDAARKDGRKRDVIQREIQRDFALAAQGIRQASSLVSLPQGGRCRVRASCTNLKNAKDACPTPLNAWPWHADPTVMPMTAFDTTDSSQWDGVPSEVISPGPPTALPLRGQVGLRNIFEMLSVLRWMGVQMGPSTGLHVHVNARSKVVGGVCCMGDRELARIWAAYAKYQLVMDEFESSSRVANQWAQSLLLGDRRVTATFANIHDYTNGRVHHRMADGTTPDFCNSALGVVRDPLTLKALRMDGVWETKKSTGYKGKVCERTYPDERYAALNLHPLGKKGTLEFRRHAGTNDVERVLRLVQFVTRFVDEFSSNAAMDKYFDQDVHTDWRQLYRDQHSATREGLFKLLEHKGGLDPQTEAYYAMHQWAKGCKILETAKLQDLTVLGSYQQSPLVDTLL